MQLSALKICDFFKFYAKNIRIRINFVILTLKLVQILVCELIRLERMFTASKFLIILLLLIAGKYSFSQAYEIDDYDGQTVITCSGPFYDSGGAAAYYGDNENHTVTFCSDNGLSILIDFTTFEVRSGDTLWIL